MKIKRLLFCLLVASLAALLGFAQDTPSNSKSKSNVRTITGCLSQGDSANEFQLTASDGSTWEVRSDQVSLAKHVGHTVAATGVVSHTKLHNLKEDAKGAAADTGVKKNNAEHGHLTVTGVKMVSDSCQR
ncbi:MAG TPA: hypothetical protein VFB00_03945 [Terriglobales bacterium]|jgi:hypothetical protein|nr:hypothetical protein [Terriglobales bacterium]